MNVPFNFVYSMIEEIIRTMLPVLTGRKQEFAILKRRGGGKYPRRISVKNTYAYIQAQKYDFISALFFFTLFYLLLLLLHSSVIITTYVNFYSKHPNT